MHQLNGYCFPNDDLLNDSSGIVVGSLDNVAILGGATNVGPDCAWLEVLVELSLWAAGSVKRKALLMFSLGKGSFRLQQFCCNQQLMKSIWIN